MALAATVEPDPIKRRNITLGVNDHNRARFLEALTDGWEAAAHLGQSMLPIAPDADFSPSGRFVLTRMPGDGSLQGRGIVRVWTAADSAPHGLPMVHELMVMGAVFTRDEQRVLTWGMGMPELGAMAREAQSWNVRDGTRVGSPMRSLGMLTGEEKIHSAGFSDDETQVLSYGDDGVARRWTAATGDPIGEPMARETGVALAMFDWPDGVITIDKTGEARRWLIDERRTGEVEIMPPGAFLERFEIAHWTSDAVGFRSRGSAKPKEFVVERRAAEFLTVAVDKSGIASPGAIRVLTWTDDGSWRLLDAATGQEIGRPFYQDQPLDRAVFSPSGDYLALIDKANTARVWDARTGRPVSSPLRHEQYITGVVFDPTERLLLTYGLDRIAQLWDCATAEPIVPAMEHPGPVHAARFSPDGSRILTCSGDGQARLWNVAGVGARTRVLRHDGPVATAVQDRNERRLLCTTDSPGDSFAAWVWNSDTGRLETAPMRHGKGHDTITRGGARLTRDETRVLTWANDGVIRLWSADGVPSTPPMTHDDSACGATLTRDESRVLTWGRDGTARLWTADGRPVGRPMKHKKTVVGAVFSADESLVLTWSEDRSARLWRASDGRPVAAPMQHEELLEGARFSPDGSHILTWGRHGRDGREGVARLWSAADGTPVGSEMRHTEWVEGADFSPDGTRILTWTRFFSAWGRRAGTARLWNARDGEPAGAVMMHRAGVNARFCCDGTRVLTWSEDSTAQLWHAADGTPAAALMVHGGDVNGVVLSGDHRRVLTWSADRTARLWNLHDGTPAAKPMEHGGAVAGALFDAGETRILTWTKDGRVRVWNAADGRLLLRVRALPAEVAGAMFCRHGRAILAWSREYGSTDAVLWSIDDLDDASDLALEVEAINGTAMDEHENVRFLTWQEWLDRCSRRHPRSAAQL
jgi:WD40 repeat protein